MILIVVQDQGYYFSNTDTRFIIKFTDLVLKEIMCCIGEKVKLTLNMNYQEEINKEIFTFMVIVKRFRDIFSEQAYW